MKKQQSHAFNLTIKLGRKIAGIATAPLFVLWGWLESVAGNEPFLPPVDLRRTYYRTHRPSAFWKACEDAKVELVSRGLQRHHRVLDIGCGIGNLAVALRGDLDGQYTGFDVNRHAIEWCRSAFSSGRPNFAFTHVDLASSAYHRGGKHDASVFQFPVPHASVDYTFAGSVFTHLLPGSAEQYIRECGRVLVPGGVCVASFFLLDSSRRSAIARGDSFMTFSHTLPNQIGLVHDLDVPEAAVAFDESWVAERFNQAGLRIVEVRRGGWWQGRDHDQDVITAVRQLPRANPDARFESSAASI